MQALFNVEPQLDQGSSQAPGPSRVKQAEQKPVSLPRTQLNSVKLVEAAQLSEKAASPAKGVPRATPSRPGPSKTSLRAESLDMLGKNNPLWAEILGREAARSGPGAQAGQGADEEAWGIDESALEESSQRAKAEVEEDWFFDSPLPVRDYATSRSRRIWRAVEAFVRSRQFSRAAAVVVLVFFLSSLNVPWRGWLGKQVQAAKGRLVTAINTLNKPIEERAAFFIAEDFQQGLDQWQSSGSGSIQLDSSGLMRVRGLALHEETLNLVDYRLDFNAKIQSRAVGWAVRAADFNNYYSFKLIESNDRGASSFHLERYAVIGGSRGASSVEKIQLPRDLAKAGIFNRISLRVRNDQITTMINGWGVDFWRDNRLKRGGIGLLASAGETAYIEKMTIAGNDDTWGLILYGTSETLRSIRDTISPPVAMTRGAMRPPVAIVLHPMRFHSFSR